MNLSNIVSLFLINFLVLISPAYSHQDYFNHSGRIKIDEVKAIRIPKFLTPDSPKTIFIKPDGTLAPSTNLEMLNYDYSNGEYKVKARRNFEIKIKIEFSESPTGVSISEVPVKINGQTYDGTEEIIIISNSNNFSLYMGVKAIIDSNYDDELSQMKYLVHVSYVD